MEHERLAEFRTWSEGVIQVLNPVRTEEQTRAMQAASDALASYMTDMLHRRRAEPQDDLVSDMAILKAKGEADIADEDLIINLSDRGLFRSKDRGTTWQRLGAAELKGQTLAERSRRLIAIAHPDFREALDEAAHIIRQRGF